MKKLIMMFSLIALNSWAQQGNQGILPGEPDPNFGPSHDHDVIVKNPKGVKDVVRDDLSLLDDRKECGKGKKRFQVYHCALEAEPEQDCKNYHAVFECSTKPKTMKCKKPKVLKPLYKCEGMPQS